MSLGASLLTILLSDPVSIYLSLSSFVVLLLVICGHTQHTKAKVLLKANGFLLTYTCCGIKVWPIYLDLDNIRIVLQMHSGYLNQSKTWITFNYTITITSPILSISL
jgi:hypothetical protein